jgi:hypothetical protein
VREVIGLGGLKSLKFALGVANPTVVAKGTHEDSERISTGLGSMPSSWGDNGGRLACNGLLAILRQRSEHPSRNTVLNLICSPFGRGISSQP